MLLYGADNSIMFVACMWWIAEVLLAKASLCVPCGDCGSWRWGIRVLWIFGDILNMFVVVLWRFIGRSTGDIGGVRRSGWCILRGRYGGRGRDWL